MPRKKLLKSKKKPRKKTSGVTININLSKSRRGSSSKSQKLTPMISYIPTAQTNYLPLQDIKEALKSDTEKKLIELKSNIENQLVKIPQQFETQQKLISNLSELAQRETDPEQIKRIENIEQQVSNLPFQFETQLQIGLGDIARRGQKAINDINAQLLLLKDIEQTETKPKKNKKERIFTTTTEDEEIPALEYNEPTEENVFIPLTENEEFSKILKPKIEIKPKKKYIQNMNRTELLNELEKISPKNKLLKDSTVGSKELRGEITRIKNKKKL